MNPAISRRHALRSSVALAVLACGQLPLRLFGFDEVEGELIPFLDVQPKGRPMLQWQELENWITPSEKVFAVSHYGQPEVDPATWSLAIGGLVRQPRTLDLDAIKRLPKKEVIATLECSGNSSNPGFMGAIGNVRWTGTPLAPLLKQSEPYDRGIEVVFYGADQKEEEIRGGNYLQNFARSLSMSDAMKDEVLLAYEMNGEPLTPEHGAPLRLVVPGWFGIAWIKWLKRIEVLDRRFMSKYMARQYVTLRGEEIDGEMLWRETSVGPIDVKSMTAQAVRLPSGAIRFSGAAWTDGTPLERVQVKIDKGDWRTTQIEARPGSPFAWKFWSYEWANPTPGDHTVISRAIDAEGRVQPQMGDPEIMNKKTYWEANHQWPRRFAI